MLDPRLIPTALTEGDRSPPAAHTRRRSTRWLRARAVFRFLHTLIRLRARGRLGGRDTGTAMRGLFESWGCMWIKLGQLLGMRRDFFSHEFCQEMSKAQEQSAAFPGHISRRILEAGLGRPVEEIFDRFGPEPFAAASIGQVHEAYLPESGVRVAIKVRRPGVARQVEKDLRFLAGIVRLLIWLRIRKELAWDDLLWELRTALLEEVDYRLEASSIRKMRKSLSRHGIYVPRIFDRYTTERILVMEFLQGVSMAEFVSVLHDDPARAEEWLEENQIDREKVGRSLYLSLNRQIFEDNLFHSDLHPGNILMLRESKVALIDFGAVGSADAHFTEKYRMYFRVITERNFSQAADLLLLLGSQPVTRAVSEEFRRRFIAIMKRFEIRTTAKALPYHGRSVVNAFGEVMRELAISGIPLDWTFMRADRAQLTLDASLMFLIPEVNYIELTRKYWEESGRRTLQGDGMARAAAPRISSAVATATEGFSTWKEEAEIALEFLGREAQEIRPIVGKAADLVKYIQQAARLGAWVLIAVLTMSLIGPPHSDAASRMGGVLARTPRWMLLLLLAASVSMARGLGRLGRWSGGPEL